MIQSLRKDDMKAEEQLGEFMDRYFYSKLHGKDGNLIKFERKRDKTSQLQGIDVELCAGNKTMIIDEKASLYYSNAMIPTFAFEIDSIQSGHENAVEGWFVNDSLSTQYYMLIWPNVKCERIKDNTWVRKDIGKLGREDFTIVEAMLIEKKKLILEVEKHGLNKSYLLEYSKRLRHQMNNSRDSKSEEINKYIKIMYSGGIAEKPINVVIKKSILKQIADAVYLISEDGYAPI